MAHSVETLNELNNLRLKLAAGTCTQGDYKRVIELYRSDRAAAQMRSTSSRNSKGAGKSAEDLLNGF